ncbi:MULTISPECIES: hypothetical protein [Brevibacillus]|uniref:DUF4367 domain-containing protein n=1 Tax=Brevibacillus brevis TaxID=1393 RepID=A0A2Z4MPK2_BREBE|nr:MULTISPECIES: hypothetical protein [Brevibacillus]AWX58009.1 hypothetical protein AB432_024545 [Brevibacillus brevis]NRR21377.1 hypothetical protein [Brevibacillus sp. MS2.2]
MTRSQQPDDWKQQLTAAADDFDVKEQVLQKIKERKSISEGKQMKKRLGLIVAAILVFGGTSAYAAMKVYELKNEKGEAVVKVQQTTTPLQKGSAESIKTFEDARNSLKPGEGAAIYIPGPDNPKKRVSFTYIPVEHLTTAPLQKEVSSFYEVPAEIAGGYKFVKGHVEYPFDYSQPELFAEMHKEAEKDKKQIVMRKVSPKPVINRVFTLYKGSAGAEKDGDVYIAITNFEGVKWIEEEAGEDAIVEKVKVQKYEGMYIARKLMDGTEEKVIKVYQEDKNRLIEVGAMNPALTKKDLLMIAENLK